MLGDKCKKCRRARQKLFLKGEKCHTPKCPITTKPYAPGATGKGGGKNVRRGGSEYGIQLREKQKVKFGYGLRERQFVNYAKEAVKAPGADTSAKFFELLESRLDSIVFRLGLADSRSKARQIVSHGHITVNGRRVDIPSYRIKKGDKIAIRPQSAPKGIFSGLDLRLKKYSPPAWLKLDKDGKTGEICGLPSVGEEAGMEGSLNTIIEFYSR
ncbi:MAG: 30S ribosomal protein S4 [bacterium]|nr:30S ribosomal protein S4 [bacterium]